MRPSPCLDLALGLGRIVCESGGRYRSLTSVKDYNTCTNFHFRYRKVLNLSPPLRPVCTCVNRVRAGTVPVCTLHSRLRARSNRSLARVRVCTRQRRDGTEFLLAPLVEHHNRKAALIQSCR